MELGHYSRVQLFGVALGVSPSYSLHRMKDVTCHSVLEGVTNCTFFTYKQCEHTESSVSSFLLEIRYSWERYSLILYGGLTLWVWRPSIYYLINGPHNWLFCDVTVATGPQLLKSNKIEGITDKSLTGYTRQQDVDIKSRRGQTRAWTEVKRPMCLFYPACKEEQPVLVYCCKTYSPWLLIPWLLALR